MVYKKRFQGLTEAEAKIILETQFERMVGYKLDLENPQTFNEKIQWLKLYYHNPLMTKCADKVAMRDYVKEKIGEEYLIPILGVYDTPEDIDFDKLPNKFVLKVNWGSGQNIICTDKSKLNIQETLEQLREWMKPENNHYYDFLEWCYKDITPKILAEEFIEANDDLIDYKFLCYNGKPLNMFLVQNRKGGEKEMMCTFFDVNFNRLPFSRKYKTSEQKIQCPEKWNEMVEKAKVLSSDFPFVRIDFYQIKGVIKVGEITFYPGNGIEEFNPIEWDIKLGQLIKLPEKMHG